MMALRQAHRKASRLVGCYPHLVGVAVGFKHSRAAGYGPVLRRSVKFLVHHKRRRLAKNKSLPKRMAINVRGRHVLVPTDVEAIGDLRVHLRPVSVALSGAIRGSPGFLLRATDGRSFLITAGHVLRGGPPNAQVALENQIVGRVDLPNTYYASNNLLFDIGVTELENNTAFTMLQERPWTNLKSVADLATLREWFYGGTTRTICRLYGWLTQPYAVLDTLDEDPLPAVGTLYAPVTIMTRAQDADYADGDSGAPLVFDEEVLVGMHVLGSESDPKIGWSVATFSIIQSLEQRLGVGLRLLTAG